MRKFYIFRIKSDFINLYQNNEICLYNALKKIYYMHREDINYGFNLFDQITDKIDKEQLDRYIFIKLHNKMYYKKYKNNHIINNLYKNEITTLKIKNTHIYMETDETYSILFNIINSFYEEYFICDFDNNDYFLASELKTLV